MWTPLQPGSDDAGTVSSVGEGSPLGRPARLAELAAAYVHLVSPESSYRTGSAMAITGRMPMF